MAQELIRKILVELQRRFRVAGRGSVTRVEQALGLSAGYFKDQRRPERQRFDLKILLRALNALKVSPAEFFASVLGSADPLEVFKSEGATLLRKKAQPPRILAAEAQRRPEEVGEEVDLDGLDALRHDDPSSAARQARTLVPVVPDAQVPGLLGVYASACRALGRSEEAIIVLTRALDRAAEQDNHAALGDLLLRAGYVFSERGQVEMACALAERSALIFARSGDLVGVGRSLLDQGMCFFHLGRARQAAQTMTVALGYLEDESGSAPQTLIQMNRWCCLMNLCIIHRSLDELDLAESYARQARKPCEGLGKKLFGRVVALEAAIARDAGRSEVAERLYREAFEAFQSIDALDAALCGIELIRVQLRLSRTPDAYRTAKAMMPLLEPLEKNRVASAALTELLRSALAGRGLTEALLRSVASGLQKGKAKPGRRARRSQK
jgi:tetratricopeptide (TPR) repeat protein